MKRNLACILTLAVSLAAAAQQNERVVSAGLFKNGLAVVTKEYTVPGPGAYTFDALGSPVHGTLWIEGDAGVVARATTRPAELSPEEASEAGIHEALLGRQVSLGLRLEETEKVTGRLIAAPGKPAPPQDPFSRTAYRSAVYPPAPAMYVLESESGQRSYIAADMVAFVTSLEAPGPVLRDKPVLTFEVAEGAANPTTIRATWLARGLSWAPGYRLDLSDPETLSIVQTAVVRNELEDLEDVELSLISGFPNVEFAHVASPFAADASWPEFFSALGRSPEELAQMAGYGIAMQSAIASNSAGFGGGGGAFGGGLGTIPPAMDEGADVYYQEIGAHRLALNESLAFDVASASAAYDTVVEWTIPDTRGEQHHYGMPRPADGETLWDAVRFKNPFPFPMTTAPAAVVKAGRFLGSKTSTWANPGEETLVYVNRALSIVAETEEKEAQDRPEVRVGGMPSMQSTIEGKLRLENRRTETVSMVIHKELTGEFVAASLEPEIRVGAHGAGQYNPSNKLTWRFDLAPGEERVVNYSYKFLVR